MSYINTWGIYQAFQGTHDELIDEKDRTEFFDIIPNGKVFECIDEGETLTLKYGDKTFNVDSQLYKVVSEPEYKIGDNVIIISKAEIAEIIDINWHIKENVPYYFVKENGKKRTRRYYEDELKKIDM